MFLLSDYEYVLPEQLIAQTPAGQRDGSRLLLLNRSTGTVGHHMFSEIDRFFSHGDLMVVNNTEVIPARLTGHKETGGKMELLILDYAGHKVTENFRENINGRYEYSCLIKAAKGLKKGAFVFFEQGLKGEIRDINDGIYKVRFHSAEDFEAVLYKIGKAPLPPYIKRQDDSMMADDRRSYQTVYASKKGAVAAPTAGLHFSKELMEKIKSVGVQVAEITLHVGYGTFLPVRVTDIRDHKMHSEWYSISAETAEKINKTKSCGGSIIAVGTTTVRTLEYASKPDGNVVPGIGACDMFIYPGYTFKVIDTMITNFHLPGSTLLMLVSAFAGREMILSAYQEAIDNNYRFFSYGDAMLIV